MNMAEKCYSSAFIIGANVTDEKKNASVARSPSDYSKEPLGGVLTDIKLMQEFMSNREILVFEVMLSNQHAKQEKSDILRTFKNFLFQKNTRRFVIYYSGHGSNGNFETKKGDWCFETNDESGSRIIYIGLKDILDLWDEMRTECGSDSYELKDRDLLFIIADCCYSGSWVEEVKERPYKVSPSGEKYRDVHMIASCKADEICYYTDAKGGDFTDRYINADSSKHNLVDTAAHIAKLTAQSVIQGVTFPLYMPIKGLVNVFAVKSHKHTPVATNDSEEYRYLLMKYDGEVLPIGKGLGIASGWSWMLRGQILHN